MKISLAKEQSICGMPEQIKKKLWYWEWHKRDIEFWNYSIKFPNNDFIIASLPNTWLYFLNLNALFLPWNNLPEFARFDE